MTIDIAALAELHPWPEQILYRFFDSAGRLLYVGITDNLRTRFNRHRRKSSWWAQAVRVGIQVFCNRTALEVAEQEAIESEGPLHNTMYNRASGRARRKREAEACSPKTGCHASLTITPRMEPCITCFDHGLPLTGYGPYGTLSRPPTAVTIYRCRWRHVWTRTQSA